MVDAKLRLESVVGLGARPKHDAGVVNQNVDVHVLREDGAGKLLHGTEALEEYCNEAASQIVRTKYTY